MCIERVTSESNVQVYLEHTFIAQVYLQAAEGTRGCRKFGNKGTFFFGVTQRVKMEPVSESKFTF